jgi:hypothetical protein
MVLGSNNKRYFCITANGANYDSGTKNPTIAANSYDYGESASGKYWLNLDSIYDKSRDLANATGTISSDCLPTVPITKGGTGATTADGGLSNLGGISGITLGGVAQTPSNGVVALPAYPAVPNIPDVSGFAPTPQTAAGVGQFTTLTPHLSPGNTKYYTVPASGTWAVFVLYQRIVDGGSDTGTVAYNDVTLRSDVVAGGTQINNYGELTPMGVIAWRIA